MERIQALISKLKEQHEQQAPGSEMLSTAQQLTNELSSINKPQATRILGTSKVSVMMPANMSSETYRNYAPRPHEEAPVTTATEPIAQPQYTPPADIAPVHTLPESIILKAHTPPAEPVPEPETEEKETLLVDDGKLSIVQENGQLDMVFDPLTEIPTLSQHFNDKRTPGGESLNDKLKQGKTEVLEFLKETPVKDLRKAIGINDRFSFINELFRGDEAMYERSIKTINGFNIFPEAEYWIMRELKTKLGWNPENEVALHFDQLVRRRFS